ncbi:hypothetical protein R1T16_01140 [Flavobacterium sp. DG1-102-2]|uniref:hypothetical protein n=1 Tax=Flavobacterium sp. DG1-102-2 TaxID=3081663 RepID=UPI0029493718|nr:hypothetical protein [Flavobacterium sp. DG1-102-2]MDV6167008.1 hypothetical protein [Flavobacterium sp. DG1-102-2]
MRTLDIVIRLNGRQQESELEIGSNANYSNFYNFVQKAIADRSADIIHKGDYFRYDHHLLPKDNDAFNTYVLFRNIALNDLEDENVIWNTLGQQLQNQRFPEVREKNEHHQLIELSSLEEDRVIDTENTIADYEDILVRIAGTREELEFDPSGAEANKILYDRLAKLVYNKEAEVMYKGPRLVFDENRDLFINPDDFSIYVLFRTRRDYNYENKEQLWNNLSNDLKTLSSITLYRASKNYQVVLFTHDI